MVIDDLTPVWKALSDPARRRILDLLRERPRTTGEISRSFAFTRYAAMKHLSVLLEAGLILVRREGRRRWNYLNPVPLEALYRRWLRPYEAVWAAALLKLKGYSEYTSALEERMKDPRELPKNGTLQIEQELLIDAPPAKVFTALTTGIGNWWPYRTKQEIATALKLEPHVGGRFFELWGDQGGILWGTVVQIKKNERLDIAGMIGMARLVHSFVSFKLEKKKSGTLLSMSHRAVGEVDEETAAEYGQGWKHLLEEALKNYLEKGEKK